MSVGSFNSGSVANKSEQHQRKHSRVGVVPELKSAVTLVVDHLLRWFAQIFSNIGAGPSSVKEDQCSIIRLSYRTC